MSTEEGSADEPGVQNAQIKLENESDEGSENVEDFGPIKPAYYWGGTEIPVFTPTMEQFKCFKTFISKINSYGMKSGIVKVIPPKQWVDAQPDLSELVKNIKVKNPIVQHINGSGGSYRQTNVEKQRTYNLMDWKQACNSEEHQPPARRGERRSRQRDVKSVPVKSSEDNSPAKRGRGRPKKALSPCGEERNGEVKGAMSNDDLWAQFDYHLENASDFTDERCLELEKAYWKTLTYNTPMYGADMPGSLFTKKTKFWNVANLDNVLNVLGRRLPGVNTAYLYLGMWKATFSWHLEDMDLYSINYIHFGAPKQWYSISQRDLKKFEKVMRNIWPDEYKKCREYLRHKSFLISPTFLAQNGITVNKLVHHEKEFVITFPFGYHSGYNLGYNCAESVNFATESWLEYGKLAKKCECIPDAVWINVWEIIGKLDGSIPIEPLPPAFYDSFPEKASRKRMGGVGFASSVKRMPLLKFPEVEPCALCPNDIADPLLRAEGEVFVHRLCATLIPETTISVDSDGNEIVKGLRQIPKARLELKCLYCHRKKGACFQCDAGKCIRAYHATCAPMAGVLVENIQIGEESRLNVKCRFHRPKRQPSELQEVDPYLIEYASALEKGNVIQVQFDEGDIFAGVVVKNFESENTVLIEVLVEGDVIEVEYKWILPPSSKHAKFTVQRIEHARLLSKCAEIEPSITLARASIDTQMSSIRWEAPETSEPSHCPDQAAADLENIWHYIPSLSTFYIDRYGDTPTSTVASTRADVNFTIDTSRRRLTAREKAEARELQDALRYKRQSEQQKEINPLDPLGHLFPLSSKADYNSSLLKRQAGELMANSFKNMGATRRISSDSMNAIYSSANASLSGTSVTPNLKKVSAPMVQDSTSTVPPYLFAQTQMKEHLERVKVEQHKLMNDSLCGSQKPINDLITAVLRNEVSHDF